jgi:CubicO group peptidase (beta-lactamase class C family)
MEFDPLFEDIGALANETGFSGVVSVEVHGAEVTAAFGSADRRHGIPVTAETRFGIASGAKGFTALTIMSLVVEGAIDLTTPVRSILGDDLPLIDRAVNIEHLLAHRSGIGDYLDEEALEHVDDHVMPLPVHLFDRTEAYIHALDGHAQKFEPGERFSYCNSGYVVLALVAERVGDASFADLVSARVIGPAGMTSTGFLRSDELPGDAAITTISRSPLLSMSPTATPPPG